jgi:hypothetical protein
MIVQGFLAGVNGSVTTETFLRFLAHRAPDGAYFLVPPPPGIEMAAVIDWRVVVQDAAAVAPLTAALWRGYESLVAPLRKGAAPAAGITVQLRNDKGQFDQFVLGREITAEATLLQRVKESVRTLYPGKPVGLVPAELERTLDSGYWVRLVD